MNLFTPHINDLSAAEHLFKRSITELIKVHTPQAPNAKPTCASLRGDAGLFSQDHTSRATGSEACLREPEWINVTSIPCGLQKAKPACAGKTG
jgi:hypothetical protein